MLLVLAVTNPARQVVARPVVCTTSLEAPTAIQASGPALPVEITRCAPVERTDTMMDRRFYTWTSPFARGVDVIHQVTDLLGIAMAGPEGNRLMGFGFPDQTIIWDGSALQNTTESLLEEQSKPIPWRTVDISSGFDSSLASEEEVTTETVMVDLDLLPSETIGPPVRGLW